MSQHEEFNLLDEPWIPVLEQTGQIREMSLLEVFQEAENTVDIAADLPTQSFALLRLLLAISHRALGGPEDVEHWREIRSGWDQAAAAIAGYLEDHRHRFNLIDPAVPFFQVQGLRACNGEVSGLEKMIIDVPNGAPFFTTRLNAGLERITAAEAARWLVHVHAFDPSGIRSGAEGDSRVKNGKGYPIGPGWAGQIGGVHLVGQTLRETLLLNLIGWSALPGDPPDPDLDLPPWELPVPSAAEDDRAGRPYGPVDLYTWQSRRVLLHGDRDGVTGLVLTQGDKITPQNQHIGEPMSMWRFSEPQTKARKQPTYMPLLHEAGRSFWRGAGSLLPTARQATGRGDAPARTRPPAVVTWTHHIKADLDSRGTAHLRARAVGLQYGTNNSVVDDLIVDELELPLALLADHDGRLTGRVTEATTSTEAAVRALTGLAVNLAEAAGIGRKERDAPRRQAAETAYALLDAPFRTWLASLAPNRTEVDALTEWHTQAHRILTHLGNTMVDSAGPAAWTGRTVGSHYLSAPRAQTWFASNLAKALGYAQRTAQRAAAPALTDTGASS